MSRVIKLMDSVNGIMQGGFFSVEISGTGVVCIATHGPPLVFKAGPYCKLSTDPTCTVCWSGNLITTLKTDITAKSLIGMGSGEEFQMHFSGAEDGFVMCQPYSELPKAKLGK